MHKVLIENASFYAFHGVHEEERKIGGKFSVDLELETNFEKALEEDEVSHTINYVEAYRIIKEEFATSSKLIEHVAGRIVKRLRSNHETIIKLRLKISKLNPPLNGEVERVSIEIEE